MQTPKDTTGKSIFVVTLSRRSKIVKPQMVKSDRLPIDKAQRVLRIVKGRNTTMTAFRRLMPKRSCSVAIGTSAIDTQDVSAATKRRTKNSVDHSCEKGRRAKISGRVTKTSVAPRRDSLSRPKLLIAGKMMSPIITATNKLINATIIDVFTNRVLRG